MECNEINIFHLLFSNAFDSLLEYTNDSLNEKKLLPLSYGEFRKFMGTLLLSSVINTSVEKSWSLMGSLTKDKHMPRERFVQILTNLRGFDMRRRIINSSSARWIDQRNTLDHLHLLEKKIFEHSIEFFFDSSYSCLVLDDEMIGSKALNVETKIVSDCKAAGEGPTCDCICDSLFQFVLGVCIKTVANSQIVNVEKLLDYLPAVDKNVQSMLGPFIACNRGYGKKFIMSLLASKNYKVITIASKIGSEHPIVGSSAVEFYIDKIKKIY
jgi:hypothetical protein